MADIGIDITPLCAPSPGGIGSSLYETLRAIERGGSAHRFLLYGTGQPYVPFSEEPAVFPWPVRVGAARNTIAWMQTGLPRMLRQDAVALFWGTRHVLPVLSGGFRKVATIHDFWYRFHPEQQPVVNMLLNRAVTTATMRTADHIVAVSDATARDARMLFGVPAERMSVIPWGVDAGRFRPVPPDEAAPVRERLGLDRPFVLAMDVFNPRKNADETLRAFALLPAELRRDLDLVAVGRPRRTARPVPVQDIAAGLGIADALRLPGDVAHDDLPAVYSAASVLAFPSVYEGFGMPLLEAMACGCPVVTSDVSSLPEVAGDAALFASPDDPAALADALARVLRDPAEAARLREAGFVRAAAFPWSRVAERMLDVFDRELETA